MTDPLSFHQLVTSYNDIACMPVAPLTLRMRPVRHLGSLVPFIRLFKKKIRGQLLVLVASKVSLDD